MFPRNLKIVLALACCGVGLDVFAISPGTATADFKYVGRVQYQVTDPGKHFGTGSYIRPSVVLTCAHVLNATPTLDDTNTFERFELVGGAQVPALGVRHPSFQFMGAVLQENDIGLMLLLNGPLAPAGGFGPVATITEAELKQGDKVDVLGFTGSTTGGNPLLGSMEIKDNSDVSAQLYIYRNPPSVSIVQGGDSGGPELFDYGGLVGKRIVSVTRSGNDLDRNTGVRTNSLDHLIFLNGGGSGGNSVLTRLNTTSNTNFSTATSFDRGLAGSGPALVNDVLVLDPTRAGNNGTDVTIDVNTPSLEGLLTDVHLIVSGKSLTVSGFSGGLNGGNMEVGGAAGSAATFGYSLENRGRIRVADMATFDVGATNTGTAPVDALWNAGNAIISIEEGGTLNVHKGGTPIDRMTNLDSAQLLVQGSNAKPAAANIDRLVNSSRVVVAGGGTLTASVELENRKFGQIIVTDGAASTAKLDAGAVTNTGDITVGLNGTLTARRTTDLPAGDTFVAKDGSTLTVNKGGTVNIRPDGTAPVGNGLTAETGSRLQVNGGGKMNLRGKNLVNGTATIVSDGTDRGIVDVTANGATDGEFRIGDGGLLRFGGSTSTPARLNLNDASLTSTGSYEGFGEIVFSAKTKYDNRSKLSLNAGLNTRFIALEFTTAFAGTTLECTVDDPGMNKELGFLDKMSLREVCIKDSSKVALIDDVNNEPDVGKESVFTNSFGIQAGSELIVDGLILYYRNLDMDCGGLAGTITKMNGGDVIQLPEPGSITVIAMLVSAAISRRSRKPTH